MTKFTKFVLPAAVLAAPIALAANLAGDIKADGSSTVAPISSKAAEEFNKNNPGVKVSVGVAGTGGGFKKFCAGETDISNASRPIKGKEAVEAGRNNVKFVELPVAYDGLTIVVNPKNDWCSELTVEDLKKVFAAESKGKVDSWDDINPKFPNEPLKLFGPGTDSGTYDYFKEVVVGKGAIREDMSASEDDNVLVKGVAGDKGALGFFGYAYFVENEKALKALAIVNPATKKAVAPTGDAIADGSYAPFSRPLFIYVNKESLAKPQVAAFAKFYLENAADLAEEVGYVRLPQEIYDRAQKNLAAKKTGTQFKEGDTRSLAEAYR